MKKQFKVLASALTVLLVSTALVGCGDKKEASTDGGKGGKTIKIWSHFDKEIPELRKQAEAWAKKTGNKVIVQKDAGKFDDLVAAAKSPKHPDVYWGNPHDTVGKFAKTGVVEEVPKGTIDESRYISTDVVNSGKFDGKQYGIPIFTETTALFVNTDKIKNDPKTFAELVETAKTQGFEFDLANLYFAHGLITGEGGFIFKKLDGGKYDTKTIGLNNEGAVKALQKMQDLVVKDKLMRKDITGDIAIGDFKSGKTAFYIGGPWDVQAITDAKIKFKVMPIPTMDGKNPVKQFMGVQTGFVLKASENKKEAWDLVKYLSEDAQLQALGNIGHRLPAVKNVKAEGEAQKGFLEAIKNAEPMPNVAEMGAVWGPVGDSLKLILKGDDVKKTADSMVKKLETQIATMNN